MKNVFPQTKCKKESVPMLKKNPLINTYCDRIANAFILSRFAEREMAQGKDPRERNVRRLQRPTTVKGAIGLRNSNKIDHRRPIHQCGANWRICVHRMCKETCMRKLEKRIVQRCVPRIIYVTICEYVNVCVCVFLIYAL